MVLRVVWRSIRGGREVVGCVLAGPYRQVPGLRYLAPLGIRLSMNDGIRRGPVAQWPSTRIGPVPLIGYNGASLSQFAA